MTNEETWRHDAQGAVEVQVVRGLESAILLSHPRGIGLRVHVSELSAGPEVTQVHQLLFQRDSLETLIAFLSQSKADFDAETSPRLS